MTRPLDLFEGEDRREGDGEETDRECEKDDVLH
jgi:hypothetical protein